MISAYKMWRKDDSPEAQPPKWLDMMDNLSPFKAFGISFGLMLIGTKFWIFTLGALAVIGEAKLGQPSSMTVYLLFVLLAESFLLLPKVIWLILPERSKSLLEAASDWLTKYNRPIVVVVSLIFSLLFTYHGAVG